MADVLSITITGNSAGLIGAVGQAEQSLGRLEQSGTKAGGVLSSVFQGLGQGVGFAAGIAGIQGIAGAMGAVQSAAIGLNSRLEQSKIGFTAMLGSAEMAQSFLTDLQAFAAKTPFAFPELVDASKRMLAFGFSASEVKPLLTAVGSAASAMGAGSAGVDRITNALGQMKAATVVQAGELNQLTEVGVPAFQILADAMGITTGQVKKLVTEGKIASDVFINAFQEWSKANYGDMMAKQAKTFEGAMSTIQDVVSMTTANAFKPLFQAVSDGAVTLSEFLQADSFQTWAVAFEVGMQGAITWVGSFLSALAPLGEAIATAFGQITSGDFAAGFSTLGVAIQTALGAGLASVQAFATEMFGAGANLIGELARGIIDGGTSLLTSAVETVAGIIASFLVGNSPPAEGPLANITQGGANTIAAWGAGALGAVDAAVSPVVAAVAGNLDQLKTAGDGAESAIRNITRAIQDLEGRSRDIKYAAEDIKRAYDDQIKALDDQIKSIEKIGDATSERLKLELTLEEQLLRQAEVQAQGDPVLRAQLRTRLDALKAQQQERKNAEAMADAEKAVGGSRKDRLRDQAEGLKLSQQEAELRERLSKAKSPEERERIQAQLKELEIRRQINSEEDSERKEAAQRRMLDAQARKEELTLQQQLDAMTDKAALAEVKAQQEAVRARKEQLENAEKVAKIEAELATGPLKEARARLQAERDGLLKPLQQQLEIMSRQKDALNEQRQAQQAIKQDVAEATKTAKEQAKAQQEAAAAVKKTAEAYTPDKVAEAAIAKAKESGAKLASSIGEGFSEWIGENFLTVAAGALGAVFGAGRGASLGATLGGLVGGPIGAALGLVFGGAIGAGIGGIAASQYAGMLQAKVEEIIGVPLVEAIKSKFGSVMQVVRDAFGTIAQVFGEGWAPDKTIHPLVNAIGLLAIEVKKFSDIVRPAFQQLGPIVQKALTGDIAGALTDFRGLVVKTGNELKPLLTQWAAEFEAWVVVAGPPMLAVAQQMGTDLLSWINTQGPAISAELLLWGQAFVDWVAPMIPPMLAAVADLGMQLLTWVAAQIPPIIEQLLLWGNEFVAWVAPQIPPLLAALGTLAAAVLTWVAAQIPPIIEQLLLWGVEFVKWVGPQIPVLLTELGKLYISVQDWMIAQIPGVTAQLAKWGFLFGAWVALEAVPALIAALPAILTAIAAWTQAAAIEVPKLLVRVGIAVAQGILEGFLEAWPTIKEKMQQTLGSIMPSWMGSGPSAGAGGGGDYDAKALAAARKYGLEDPTGFAAQLRQESGNYDPEVVSGRRKSSAGATGIAQFMPGTAIQYGVDPTNPDASIDAAARYMSDLQRQTGSQREAAARYYGAPRADSQVGRHYLNAIEAQRANVRVQTSGVAQVSQFALGLSPGEAEAACGPAALAWFMNQSGRTPTGAEAKQLAIAGGWDATRGMYGPGAFSNALTGAGVSNVLDTTPTAGEVDSLARSGSPFAISTGGYTDEYGKSRPGHYYQVQGGSAAGLNVGLSGTAVKGGSPVMSLEQILALSGPMNGIITLSGQMGDAVEDAGTRGGAAFEGLLVSATKMADGSTVTITRMGENVVATITNAAGEVTAQYGEMASGVVEQTAGMVTPVTEQFDTMRSGSLQSVTDMGTGVLTTTQDMAGNTIATVTDMTGQVTSQSATLANGVSLNMADMGVKSTTSVNEMAGTITTVMTDTAGNTVSTVTDMSGKVVSQFATIAGGALAVVQPVESMGEALTSVPTPNYDRVVGALKGIERAAENAKSALDEVSEAFEDAFENADADEERGGARSGSSGLAKRAGGGRTSGLTLVGEEGPELISPTRPVYVSTATETNRMLGGGQGGGPTAREIAAELALALGPLIAASRPINNYGTTEELARKVRADLRNEEAAYNSLRGI